MFSFRTTPFLDQPDIVLRSGRLGVLCNQTAWLPEKGEYLFETLFKSGRLKRIFTPEHGLFGELQDQERLDSTDSYKVLGLNGCEIISLYGSDDNSLSVSSSNLNDIDALIVELQDIGSRHYTYISTLYNLFKVLKQEEINLPIYIVDRLNPAGRQVEGTMLEKGYESFIGIEGLVHRHGLTFGELANMFYNELNAKFPLHIISYKAERAVKELLPWSIPPSPNIPGLFTCHFYSGQVLWEGTNVSEGRGTTRPFEQFGAPFMSNLLSYNQLHGLKNWNDPDNPMFDSSVYIRWQKFIPTFHKYKGEVCTGFQLIPVPGMQYHALAHNLKIIRFVAENCPEFQFREGIYERGNDKSAIELLLGDKLLLDYVSGNVDWNQVKDHIKIEEQKWIRKARKFLLYDEQLFRCKQF
ncbi:MAG: DUF1343 domain-containing protein [Bacteroidales bacterium]|jgi:uncharacterized protein YbbC (DUF1343 family)|nr:DUF1343 domain-containing protein [Bacteroidales bacterium]